MSGNYYHRRLGSTVKRGKSVGEAGPKNYQKGLENAGS
jgi:hypothetical protein